MRDPIAARIEAFVRETFSVAPGDPRFGRTAPLFELGYIDSVGVVELLTFVEGEFGVAIPDEDLMSDDFSTIQGIAATVLRRLGRQDAAPPASRQAGAPG